MRSVRIWFSKTGTAKYISHLDLTRCLIRTFRRTTVPLWYTEGFNPRPHLVFGLSLPLGVEGLCEAFDIRLDDDSYKDDEVLSQLKSATVPGIEFLKVTSPEFKPLDIAFADYVIKAPAVALNIVKEKLSSGNVLIEKKNKKKEIKTINVCDYISNVDFKTEGDKLEFYFRLPAGNDFTINPVLFCGSLFENTSVDPHMCLIKRLGLFIKDGTEYR